MDGFRVSKRIHLPALAHAIPRMGFLLDIILAAAGCCLPSSACQALMGGLSSWEEGDYGGLLP